MGIWVYDKNMSFVLSIFSIVLHALVAWMLVEVFVNNAHRLSRKHFVFFHYMSVVSAFSIVFFVYFHFFAFGSVFFVTTTAISVLLLLEWIVFGHLYSGEKWFLNYVDWIFPLFLATSTIYLMGTLA